MHKILAIAFLLLSQITQSQTSTFKSVYRTHGAKASLPEYVKGIHWIISDSILDYTENNITIQVEKTRIDTIYYKAYRRKEYDTLICRIEPNQTYFFIYNECCGGFNAASGNKGPFYKNTVTFNSTNNSNTMLLGSNGSSSTTIQNNTSTRLIDHCKSAMAANTQKIQVETYMNCSDSENCDYLSCYQQKDEVIFEKEYQSIEQLITFLYLPLSNEPLIVNINNQEISLE